MKKVLFLLFAISALSFGATEGIVKPDNPNGIGEATINVNATVNIKAEEIGFKITTDDGTTASELITLNHGEIQNGTEFSNIEENIKAVSQTLYVEQTSAEKSTGKVKVVFRDDNVSDLHFKSGENTTTNLTTTLSLNGSTTEGEGAEISYGRDNRVDFTVTSTLSNGQETDIYESAENGYATDPKEIVVTYTKTNAY